MRHLEAVHVAAHTRRTEHGPVVVPEHVRIVAKVDDLAAEHNRRANVAPPNEAVHTPLVEAQPSAPVEAAVESTQEAGDRVAHWIAEAQRAPTESELENISIRASGEIKGSHIRPHPIAEAIDARRIALRLKENEKIYAEAAERNKDIVAARTRLAEMPRTEAGLTAHLKILGARADATDKWYTAHVVEGGAARKALLKLGFKESRKAGVYIARDALTERLVGKIHEALFRPDKAEKYVAATDLSVETAAYGARAGEIVSTTAPVSLEGAHEIFLDEDRWGLPAVGETFKHDGQIVTVVKVGRKHKTEDGRSFGFDRDDVWLRSAHVRPATEAEAADWQKRVDAAKAERERQHEAALAKIAADEAAAAHVDTTLKGWLAERPDYVRLSGVAPRGGTQGPALAHFRDSRNSRTLYTGTTASGRPYLRDSTTHGHGDGGDWRDAIHLHPDDADAHVLDWARDVGLTLDNAREHVAKYGGQVAGSEMYERFIDLVDRRPDERVTAHLAATEGKQQKEREHKAALDAAFAAFPDAAHAPEAGWTRESARAAYAPLQELGHNLYDGSTPREKTAAVHAASKIAWVASTPSERDRWHTAARGSQFPSHHEIAGYAPMVALDALFPLAAERPLESRQVHLGKGLAKGTIYPYHLGEGTSNYGQRALATVYVNEHGDTFADNLDQGAADRLRQHIPGLQTQPAVHETWDEARALYERGAPWWQTEQIGKGAAGRSGISHPPPYRPALDAAALATRLRGVVPDVGTELETHPSMRRASFSVGARKPARVHVYEGGRIEVEGGSKAAQAALAKAGIS